MWAIVVDHCNEVIDNDDVTISYKNPWFSPYEFFKLNHASLSHLQFNQCPPRFPERISIQVGLQCSSKYI
jgi:hypothetical protein